MATFLFDHLHLRSQDPDATARFFETLFDAEVTRGTYPPGTLYPGQLRVTMQVGGQKILIAPTQIPGLISLARDAAAARRALIDGVSHLCRRNVA